MQLLEIDRDEIIEKLKDARDFPSSFPVKIESDMSMDQVAKVEANKFYLPGVVIQIEPKRNYPFGPMLSHALGYVSEVSTEELKTEEYKKYAIGDTIGKFGLERMYEKYLRGVDGEQRVEVDASGKEIRTLDTKEPISGDSIYLNIDLNVQTTIEKALEGKKGAQSSPTRAPGAYSPSSAIPPSTPTSLRPAHGNTGRTSPPTRPTPCRTGSSRGASPQAPRSSRWWRSPPWRRAPSTSIPASPAAATSPSAATSSSAGRKRATARWPSIGASSPPATSSSTTRASGPA